jgi:hypothetical protein
LPENIILGCRRLPLTKAAGYYGLKLITFVKVLLNRSVKVGFLLLSRVLDGTTTLSIMTLSIKG